MKMSDKIEALAQALSEAEGELKAAPFDSENQFLHNKFATLGSVIETARPVLAKHGLAIIQFPCSSEGKIGVETILTHASGQWISQEIYLPLGDEKGKSLAQVAGSIITYLRRYSLSAALNMYADEDTDAETGKSRVGAAEEVGGVERVQGAVIKVGGDKDEKPEKEYDYLRGEIVDAVMAANNVGKEEAIRAIISAFPNRGRTTISNALKLTKKEG